MSLTTCEHQWEWEWDHIGWQECPKCKSIKSVGCPCKTSVYLVFAWCGMAWVEVYVCDSFLNARRLLRKLRKDDNGMFTIERREIHRT